MSVMVSLIQHDVTVSILTYLQYVGIDQYCSGTCIFNHVCKTPVAMAA